MRCCRVIRRGRQPGPAQSRGTCRWPGVWPADTPAAANRWATSVRSPRSAIDRYDASRNVPFTSYAAPTILGEIKRYFRDATWTIRVPRRIQEARIALAVATEHLTRQLQGVPSTTDLGAALRLSTSDVDAARRVGSAYRPLSQPRVSADGEMISAFDLVGGPDPEYEAVDRRLSLRPMLDALSERDRRIIALRFIDELTQAEIGVTLGISQMHVSRLLTRSLATLRDQMIANGG